MKPTKLKAVDFFCSWGWMSSWVQTAWIQVLAWIDFDPSCKETYEANIKWAKYILADVSKLTEKDLEKEIWIKKNDDSLVLIGCSPCQYWTIIRTSKKKSQKSKDLLHEFHRFVKYFNPGYVMVENVPWILNKRDESGLDRFIKDLEDRWYKVSFEVVNLNNYWVPETRKRFSLIANRIWDEKIFPKADKKNPTVKDFIGTHNGFPKIPDGHKDNSDFMHTTAWLSDANKKRLKLTPKNWGSRESWSKTTLQLEAYKRNKNIGFKDTYGRMNWDKPAPTITTKFFSISNWRFAHPEEDRPISLREWATLQTFPKNYKFHGTSISSVARMIWNAVPPKYAEKLGETIISNHRNYEWK